MKKAERNSQEADDPTEVSSGSSNEGHVNAYHNHIQESNESEKPAEKKYSPEQLQNTKEDVSVKVLKVHLSESAAGAVSELNKAQESLMENIRAVDAAHLTEEEGPTVPKKADGKKKMQGSMAHGTKDDNSDASRNATMRHQKRSYDDNERHRAARNEESVCLSDRRRGTALEFQLQNGKAFAQPLSSNHPSLGSGLDHKQSHNMSGTRNLDTIEEGPFKDDEGIVWVDYGIPYAPPFWRNPRFLLLAFGGIVVVFGVVVIATLLSIKVSENEETFTRLSPAPTPVAREGERVMERIVDVMGQSAMLDIDSPAALAADWIINVDPMRLSAEDENLIQRYVLVLFYVATTQEKPWLSCNAPEGSTANDTCDYAIIDQVYPDLTYTRELGIRWLSPQHECRWAGVSCGDFNETRQIELIAQEIHGTFPTELALLTQLQSIALHWNEFHGPLPTILATMNRLLNIELHYNDFTGTIPLEWYESTALQRINVGENLLTGTVATDLGRLTNLKGFHCFENLLTGTVPTEIGKLSAVSHLRWQRNSFTGTLPSEMGNFHRNMVDMWFQANDLNGTLPSELMRLTNLADLRLHVNDISGTIPAEMYVNLKKLTRLDLSVMKLQGTLSSEIGLMGRLQMFRIAYNDFWGTIPTEVGLLNNLKDVLFQGNRFTGAIPTGLCSMRATEEALGLGLSSLVADCLGPVPEINCTDGCCTECCNREVEFCPPGGPSSYCCLSP